MTPIPINSYYYQDNFIQEGWNRDRCFELDSFKVSDSSKVQDFTNFVNDVVVKELEEREVDVKEIMGEGKLDFQKAKTLLDYITSEGFFRKFPKIDYEYTQWINFIVGMQYHADYLNSDEMLKYQNTYNYRSILSLFKNITKNIDS